MEYKNKLVRKRRKRAAQVAKDAGQRRIKVRGRKRWVKPKSA